MASRLLCKWQTYCIVVSVCFVVACSQFVCFGRVVIGLKGHRYSVLLLYYIIVYSIRLDYIMLSCIGLGPPAPDRLCLPCTCKPCKYKSRSDEPLLFAGIVTEMERWYCIISTNMYPFIYIYTYTHAHTHMSNTIYKLICAYSNTRIHTCICNTYIRLRKCLATFVSLHEQRYIYIHIYIYTLTHGQHQGRTTRTLNWQQSWRPVRPTLQLMLPSRAEEALQT